MFYKEYLLFRDGWDEDSEKETEEKLVQCARPCVAKSVSSGVRGPAEREQFIKIMECLDKDKNLEFNAASSRGNRSGLKQAGPYLYSRLAPEISGETCRGSVDLEDFSQDEKPFETRTDLDEYDEAFEDWQRVG